MKLGLWFAPHSVHVRALAVVPVRRRTPPSRSPTARRGPGVGPNPRTTIRFFS